jgi:hypothetical protein
MPNVAARESLRTTELYDRAAHYITLSEVETGRYACGTEELATELLRELRLSRAPANHLAGFIALSARVSVPPNMLSFLPAAVVYASMSVSSL